MLAEKVLDLARAALNDTDDVQFTLDTKIQHLNQGQLWIADLKSDSCAVTESVQLVAGTLQTLPTGGLRFLRLVRVRGSTATEGPGAVIRAADLDTMDRMYPDWHETKASRIPKNYLYDPRRKTEYYVWPPIPASPDVYVELQYVPSPTEVPLSTDSPAYDNDYHTIGIPDDFVQGLVDYVAWRLYLRHDDAESENKAQMHMQSFYQGMGIKASRDRSQFPTERQQFARLQAKEDAVSG